MSDLLRQVLEHYGVSTGKRVVSCPFHPDRRPSCSVDYAKGLFHCFSCGQGGDAYTLIMRKEDVNYGTAVKWAESTLGHSTKDSGESNLGVRNLPYGIGGKKSPRKGDKPRYRPFRSTWGSR